MYRRGGGSLATKPGGHMASTITVVKSAAVRRVRLERILCDLRLSLELPHVQCAQCKVWSRNPVRCPQCGAVKARDNDEARF